MRKRFLVVITLLAIAGMVMQSWPYSLQAQEVQEESVPATIYEVFLPAISCWGCQGNGNPPPQPDPEPPVDQPYQYDRFAVADIRPCGWVAERNGWRYCWWDDPNRGELQGIAGGLPLPDSTGLYSVVEEIQLPEGYAPSDAELKIVEADPRPQQAIPQFVQLLLLVGIVVVGIVSAQDGSNRLYLLVKQVQPTRRAMDLRPVHNLDASTQQPTSMWWTPWDEKSPSYQEPDWTDDVWIGDWANLYRDQVQPGWRGEFVQRAQAAGVTEVPFVPSNCRAPDPHIWNHPRDAFDPMTSILKVLSYMYECIYRESGKRPNFCFEMKRAGELLFRLYGWYDTRLKTPNGIIRGNAGISTFHGGPPTQLYDINRGPDGPVSNWVNPAPKANKMPKNFFATKWLSKVPCPNNWQAWADGA